MERYSNLLRLVGSEGSAHYVVKRLNEPSHIIPVVRRAIEVFGFEYVLRLVEKAESRYGREFTEGRLRTRGGIFIKILKQLPEADYIFRGKV